MLCENCHKREAKVKLTQVIGSEKKTLNICTECAEEQGLNNPMLDVSKVFGKIILALLSEHLTIKSEESDYDSDVQGQCSGCGLVWGDFKKTGRLGCPECYDKFMRELKILLRRIHGSNRHIGSSRETRNQMEQESQQSLKKKLKNAIQNEEYEIAAQLRDRIREMEQKRH